ncbi:hypothetical protein FC87_GL000722 [Fructilactobacillus florum DSM 22689 = JCM 16035]|uniref:Uncharacterized protein n=2 Tax=Fructilactobacillus florum TaxID=640331 RepID=A0A0R2CUA5_9LACO|nr:hypothetical protein FC87_GL000722 [Fructilactobacillus florum DSM 22689 = JCM 16035]
MTNEEILNAEKERVKQLVAKDQLNADKIDSIYQQAMTVASATTKVFFDKYQQDGQLSLSDVSQSPTQWDIEQYQKAINQMMATASVTSDLRKQLNVLYQQALLTRRSLLGSLLGSAVVIATANVKELGHKVIKSDYQEGYNHFGGGS